MDWLCRTEESPNPITRLILNKTRGMNSSIPELKRSSLSMKEQELTRKDTDFGCKPSDLAKTYLAKSPYRNPLTRSKNPKSPKLKNKINSYLKQLNSGNQ